MAETADAVVVGGGILGASAAYYPGRLGFDKLALEKQTVASGSTGKSAPVVHSFYSNEICLKLARRAVDIFEDFHEELGEDVGFNWIGYMVITDQSATVERVTRTSLQARYPTLEVIPERGKKMLPHMNVDDIAAAGHEPDSGYADPFLTVAALVQKGRGMESQIFQKREVEKVNVRNGQVESVDTTRGPISTRVVSNTGGTWALKVHSFPDIPLPLRPSSEQDCMFQSPAEFKSQPAVSDPILGVYSRSDGGGRLLAGGGYSKGEEPCDPDRVDERSDEGFADSLKKKLVRRFPSLSGAAVVQGWAGMYTITPDWCPIVEKAPGTDGYYLAVGGSGHSFKIGPLIDISACDTRDLNRTKCLIQFGGQEIAHSDCPPDEVGCSPVQIGVCQTPNEEGSESFVIDYPNCGCHGVYEFRFGGERRQRPSPQTSDTEWTDFVHRRSNLNGVQEEWWYHRDGCGKWFLAERDTTCNEIKAAYWAKEPAQ